MTTDNLIAQGQRKLHLDEKVEWVWERDENIPTRGMHRFQHIQLVRDGRMRHFIWEMGPSSNYPLAHPFNFWAAGDYSVGECQEIAERMREGKPPEEREPINLALSYLRLIEEKAKRKAHKSVFGSRLVKVR